MIFFKRRLFIVFFLVILGSCKNDKLEPRTFTGWFDPSHLPQGTGAYMLGFALSYAYDVLKLQIIAEFIDKFQNESHTNNITLVATQNVFNEDGSLKEIRTIELFIPKIIEEYKQIVTNRSFFDVRKETLQKTNKEDLDIMFASLSKLHLPTEVIIVENNDNDKLRELNYLSKDHMVKSKNGTFYITKGRKDIENSAEMEKILNDLEEKNSAVNILKWDNSSSDKNKTLLRDKSKIFPELLARIESHQGMVTEKIVTANVHALAYASLETDTDGDIAGRTENILKTKLPEYDIKISLDECDNSKVDVAKDFSMTLKYGFRDIFDDNKKLHVCGIRKA